MPEGPECRRIAESLAKEVSSKTIVGIDILSGRYTKKQPSGLSEIISELPIGVVGVGVHGKFIYWILLKEYSLWNTLGMSGSWTREQTKHSRLKFRFSDGSSVYFTDQRNFGTIKLVKGKNELIKKLQSLGPDMLSEDVSDEKFLASLRKKNKHNVCKAIMDQGVVAGVGNYVKAEALWLAKINPNCLISELTDDQLICLNDSIKRVLKASYESGGATIQSYKDLDGKIGDYSSKFLVYNQKTDPHGNEVIKKQTPDGRTTHWVPQVQV